MGTLPLLLWAGRALRFEGRGRFENRTLDLCLLQPRSVLCASVAAVGTVRVCWRTWASQAHGLVDTLQFWTVKMDISVSMVTGVLYLVFLTNVCRNVLSQVNGEPSLSCV